MMKKYQRAAIAVAALSLATGSALAQEVKIGLSSEPTSMDPHFHNVGPNNMLRRHIFQSLVSTDDKQSLTPELAVSWKALNDTTWEFKLRPEAKFSDGTDLTATDVIYTMCRIPKVENSPSSFTVFTRGIEAITASDAKTVVIKTATAAPLLPNNLSTIGIVSAKAFGGEGVVYDKAGCQNLGNLPKSTDFNDVTKAIGTGPYKLAEYTRGAQTVIVRSDSFWGPKSTWARVVWRPISSAGPRVAALLAGDVDLIENPQIEDLPRIKSAGFSTSQALSNRIIYLHVDQFAGADWKTPGVKGTDKNPFLDKRVREAVSKAINRQAIVDRIMGGVAQSAAELLPVPLFGSSPDMKPTAFNPDGARKLLAEAGYPNGFELVLGTPNDRYINDGKVAEAVAQMLTRIGIKTSVDAMTASTFFSRRNKFEFSVYLAGWGADSGEMSNSLNALVLTPNTQMGGGHTNRGRYSNPKVDELTYEAMRTIDNTKREALLREASKIAMGDVGIIPLHFEVTTWAFKKGFDYKPRVDQYTLATDLMVAK
jgi:peptide/nickel transport system substrate-binding protein